MNQKFRLWLICVSLTFFAEVPNVIDMYFPNNAQKAMQSHLESELFLNGTNKGDQSLMDIIWAIFIDEGTISAAAISFLVPWMAETLGRVRTLLLSVSLGLFGHLAQGLSYFNGAWVLLFFGRLWLFLWAEAIIIVLPIFINEISPPKVRGRLGSVMTIGMAVGTLTSAIIGLPTLLGNANFWPYGYILMTILAIPSVPICLFLQETPTYLLARDKLSEAKASLVYYRGSEALGDLDKLAGDAASLQKTSSNGLDAFKELLQYKPLRKPLKLAIVIVIAYTAPILLNSYSTATFEAAGFDNVTSTYLTLGMKVVSLFAFLICFACIDKYGRRPLVVGGLFGATISWAIMLIAQGVKLPYLFCVALYFAQIFFNLGVRPVFWVLVPETFPYKFRSVAKSFTVVFFGIYDFFMFLIYYPLLRNYAVVAHAIILVSLVFSLIYTYRYLPETKERLPHEIFPELAEKEFSPLVDEKLIEPEIHIFPPVTPLEA